MFPLNNQSEILRIKEAMKGSNDRRKFERYPNDLSLHKRLQAKRNQRHNSS